MHKVFELYFFGTGIEHSYSDIDGLVVHNGDMPTKEEIAGAVKRYEEHLLSQDYISKRVAEYPTLPDQLDMIYNLGIDGWKSEIKKIKDKFPSRGEER